MNEEEQVIRAFFLRERQHRYIEFISSPKHRGKFFKEMAHFTGLDERYKRAIPSTIKGTEAIAKLLLEMGSGPVCWAISDQKEIDGKRLPILEALDAIFCRTFCTLLSCRPGRLAYFENEDGRWLLRRT